MADPCKALRRQHQKSHGFRIFAENLGKTNKNQCPQPCFPFAKVTVIHAPFFRMGGGGGVTYARIANYPRVVGRSWLTRETFGKISERGKGHNMPERPSRIYLSQSVALILFCTHLQLFTEDHQGRSRNVHETLALNPRNRWNGYRTQERVHNHPGPESIHSEHFQFPHY